MYSAGTTESNTSVSYLDLLLSIGRDGQLHTSLYNKPDHFNFHIANFPFSWVAIFHLHQPMVCLSHSSCGMPGLAPLMIVLFREQPNRFMSRNVWNRPIGSSMVDTGISSNIMKSHSPKCYMTFWDMIICSDTLHWSDISLNRDFISELDLITFLM